MPPREGESPAARRRPVPGLGGCALFPAGAHPHFSPPQPPLGRTPSEPLSRPPQALPKLGLLRRERGRPGSGRDASQGVSPQSPCHTALRRRAHGTPQRAPAADVAAAAADVAAAGRAGGRAVAARSRDPGRRGAATGTARSHSPHAAARGASPALRAAAGVQGPKPGERARLTGGARGSRLGGGARELGSSLALREAPGSAAGAARELPTCDQDGLRRLSMPSAAPRVPRRERRAADIPLLRALAAAARGEAGGAGPAAGATGELGGAGGGGRGAGGRAALLGRPLQADAAAPPGRAVPASPGKRARRRRGLVERPKCRAGVWEQPGTSSMRPGVCLR